MHGDEIPLAEEPTAADTALDGESGRPRPDDQKATPAPTVEHASADAAPELFFD